MLIVVQHDLQVTYVVEDESWVRKNIFHTRCTFMARCAWLSLIVATSRTCYPWSGAKA